MGLNITLLFAVIFVFVIAFMFSMSGEEGLSYYPAGRRNSSWMGNHNPKTERSTRPVPETLPGSL
jgi:hypothetical protein